MIKAEAENEAAVIGVEVENGARRKQEQKNQEKGSGASKGAEYSQIGDWEAYLGDQHGKVKGTTGIHQTAQRGGRGGSERLSALANS